MDRQGWTVARLVKVSGIARSALYKWRDGTQEPSVPSLVKVADALRTSLDYLAGRMMSPPEGEAAAARQVIPGLPEDEERVLLAYRRDPSFKRLANALLRERDLEAKAKKKRPN